MAAGRTIWPSVCIPTGRTGRQVPQSQKSPRLANGSSHGSSPHRGTLLRPVMTRRRRDRWEPSSSRSVLLTTLLFILVALGVACTYPAHHGGVSQDAGVGVDATARDGGVRPDATDDVIATPDGGPCNMCPPSLCATDPDCPPDSTCVVEEFCDDCGCCTASTCQPSNCLDDSQCGWGSVCRGERCESCQAIACDMWCPGGYLERNGCEVCECATECRSDEECPGGEVCMPGANCDDLCMSGDPACCEGNWCAPPRTCDAPSPACDPTLSCNPSSCECLDGEWVCTSDCRPLSARCAVTACGPIPGCTDTIECGPNYTCTPINSCAPSGCVCHDSGQWQCDSECGGGVCLNATTFCPPIDDLGCITDIDCYDGYVCIEVSGVCAQSCTCDPVSGTWACDDDCAPGLCVLPD